MTVFSPPRQKIVLKNEDLFCEIWPEIGGSVAQFQKGGIALLRPTPAQESYVVTDLACFPLVPYSNRIKDGTFTFNGQKIVVPRGPADPAHALHGHGWVAPWTVEEQKPEAARLSFSRPEDAAWPFSYRAEQLLALSQNALTLTLSMENTGTGDMPAGLGLHPYFPRPVGTKLEAAVEKVWLTTPEVIPTERVSLPPEWDLRKGLYLDAPELDNCFTGWNGTAKLIWPDVKRSLLLESAEAKNLVVYCPKGKDFVCVEPVTNIIDAHNRIALGETDTGLKTLRPGEKISMTMKLSLF